MEPSSRVDDGSKQQRKHGSNGGLCNQLADEVRSNGVAALAAFPLYHHPLRGEDIEGLDQG